jgi:hypothetical protein
MTAQTDLFENVDTKAHARHGHPETSKAAARSIEPTLRASQLFILQRFREYGDMNDKQLEVVVRDTEKATGRKPMSPSGIRSRRAELCRANTERIAQLGAELHKLWPNMRVGEIEAIARRQLRAEGFRSPLWDTGKRVEVDGHMTIVWGIAK